MKEEYIERINDLMRGCEDISLLNLIFQLLMKSNKVTLTGVTIEDTGSPEMTFPTSKMGTRKVSKDFSLNA